jgi:hypothetical protein
VPVWIGEKRCNGFVQQDGAVCPCAVHRFLSKTKSL